MKKFKKITIFLILLIIAGIAGYLIVQRQNTNTLKSFPQTQVTDTKDSLKQIAYALTCPIDINVGEYKEFFRLGNETPISDKPVLVDNPSVIKINKSFEDRKKEIMKMIVGEDGETEDGSLGVHESGKFDVDGDGIDEIFMTADIYMNHRPHIVMMVKNGNIIFEASGGSIWIEKVYENKGFLLSEEIDRAIGEYQNTRYVFKDGGFVPVWTQKICYAQFRK